MSFMKTRYRVMFNGSKYKIQEQVLSFMSSGYSIKRRWKDVVIHCIDGEKRVDAFCSQEGAVHCVKMRQVADKIESDSLHARWRKVWP